MEHLHPMGAKAPSDSVYEHGLAGFQRDGILFQRRETTVDVTVCIGTFGEDKWKDLGNVVCSKIFDMGIRSIASSCGYIARSTQHCP